MARFTLPRDLYHGKGSLEALKSFKGERAVICVGGGSMKKFGFLDRAVNYLKEAGMEVELIEGIEPDPSVDTVMKGAAKMLEFKPDWIIAMGGGSPIDAAKAMWIKYEYPEITFEEMCKVFGIPSLRKKAHFCAISSTSGTATEVTAFSIITDYAKGIKYPIADFEITPDVAIVDPDLAETMPKKLVAHTGMDAMTHAIEAYVSTANCEFTDPLAIHAIEMIQKDLVASYNGDMASRDRMHYAQCLAGQAFSNALLGIVHSMAHKTGAIFQDYGAHIIHGAANAMYLPKVIAFNAKDPVAKQRYGVIADYMHLGGKDDDEKVKLLIAYLRKMNDDLNIPHCIKNYGADSYPCEQGFVPENVFLERVEDIAKNALLDACTGSNPRQPSQEEMVKLLKCCYYDTEVDF
ncbi:iron-containing alcohol dehydrogenase [Bullifex sp.]|uniref:iron-containing alcohol dehydrogenase n=1 Tax=Bullifex sp. TaxID=2815808 RepID=UPI002A815101|nr:iron-containing alcohol dehydrogenase [Bullifex sp.]MDD5972819.1 iron-containing alcohol dehydrogenase [Spirochaetales bacterium]MDY4067096.1 iron-containing alcohol dehydrogenase [Bullifex sp.]